MTIDFSGIGNITSPTSVNSTDSTSCSNTNSGSKPILKFSGNRKAFSEADPHLRNMINYSAEQQELWTLAFGEPTVVKTRHDGFHVVSKTWQTDRGPVTVEEVINKNGSIEGHIYKIGLANGSTACYDSNGDLQYVIRLDGSKLYYNHDDGSSSTEDHEQLDIVE